MSSGKSLMRLSTIVLRMYSARIEQAPDIKAYTILTSFHYGGALRLRVFHVFNRLLDGLVLEPSHGDFQLPHSLRIVMAPNVSPCAADSLEIILGYGRLALEETRAVLPVGYPLESL